MILAEITGSACDLTSRLDLASLERTFHLSDIAGSLERTSIELGPLLSCTFLAPLILVCGMILRGASRKTPLLFATLFGQMLLFLALGTWEFGSLVRTGVAVMPFPIEKFPADVRLIFGMAEALHSPRGALIAAAATVVLLMVTRCVLHRLWRDDSQDAPSIILRAVAAWLMMAVVLSVPYLFLFRIMGLCDCILTG